MNSLECVQYKCSQVIYENEKGEIQQGVACLSKNFKSNNENLVSIARLAESLNIDLYSKEYQGLPTVDKIKVVIDMVNNNTDIQDFNQYLANLLYIDYIFLNEDRHFHNIILLYNYLQDSWKTYPIFDNGASLLSDITIDYPMTKMSYAIINKVKAKPFNHDFNK